MLEVRSSFQILESSPQRREQRLFPEQQKRERYTFFHFLKRKAYHMNFADKTRRVVFRISGLIRRPNSPARSLSKKEGEKVLTAKTPGERK